MKKGSESMEEVLDIAQVLKDRKITLSGVADAKEALDYEFANGKGEEIK